MQNLLRSLEYLEALLELFLGLLKPKSKMENNHLFAKNLHGV
jgi:hypothetical protein